MDDIKFSIIIPIYKVEKYLNECVDSVLKQTYKNFEIILVDDGSPDGCPAICDNLADTYDYIKVIHKQNGGLSEARNCGLSEAIGEYIIFLDSDDYWKEEFFLQNVIKFLSDNCNVDDMDIVLFQAEKFIESTGTYIPDNYYSSSLINKKSKQETIKYLLESEAYSMQACTKILRREFLEENDINFTKGLLGEDLDWFLNVILKTKNIYALDDINYIYRIRKGSITDTIGKKNIADCIWMMEKWTKIIKQSEMQECYFFYYYGILAYAYVISLLNYRGLSKSDRLELKYDLKKYSYLLKYTVNKRIKITQISYKLFGFEFTTKLLNFYYHNIK